MTGRNDPDDDAHDDDVPRRDLGEVPVDELVEPTTDFRTVQEREAVSDSETVSGDEDCGCPGDAVRDELDELAEPATDLRTAQEEEAVDAAGEADQEGDGDE